MHDTVAPVGVGWMSPGDDAFLSTDALAFAPAIYRYIDRDAPASERAALVNLGAKTELRVRVRDRGYAAQRAALDKTVAVISHDSRDKTQSLARLRKVCKDSGFGSGSMSTRSAQATDCARV
jgi:hypothetical protein